ncbi:MAG TPA: hypothetical protein VHY84_27240 [Bryobacteraceae bacterium]|jgi:hypothetical protein|nr:hypothetical protein [Bryobacteraceae bacterium]
MPIRADLRHFYRGLAWRARRERILARAGDCCEQCGKPNHATVETHTGTSILGGNVMFWRETCGAWIRDDGTRGSISPRFSVTVRVGPARTIHVVLTIAHLNHVAGDDRDENLKALCQWCHLNYDKLHHRNTRAERKDRNRPLLAVAV